MTTYYRTAAPTYAEVEKYVQDGLPKDNWARNMYEENHEDNENEKVWYDSDDRDNYDRYPAPVLYSARFRDGLVADSEVYTLFDRDFCNGIGSHSSSRICWHEQFFDHCRVVFDFLAHDESNENNICTGICTGTNNHNTASFVGKTSSGHKGSMCLSAIHQSRFLDYCLSKIEGYQTQRLMREKLFVCLHEEAQNLPNHHHKKHRDRQYQHKWLHSLQVVLTLFRSGADPWLTFKFYGPDDVDYLFKDLVPRVKQTMSHLKNNNVFDTLEGSEILISLLWCMNEVEMEFSEISPYMDDKQESRNTLFSPLLKIYKPLAEASYAKHHQNDVLKPLALDIPDEEDEEDEEEEEQEQEQEQEQEDG